MSAGPATFLFLLALQEGQAPAPSLVGHVTEADGRAVVGADVHLRARPIPWRTECGEITAVRTVSDASGRFEVELRADRVFTAWATWRTPRGETRITMPVEGVRPGLPLRLVADPQRKPLRVRVEGLAAWAAHGPLRCIARSWTADVVEADVMLDATGCGDVPWLPGADAELQVRAADGRLLALDWVPLRQVARAERVTRAHAMLVARAEQTKAPPPPAPAADAGVHVVTIRAPKRIAITVQGIGGVPLIGAEIWCVMAALSVWKDGTCQPPPAMRAARAFERLVLLGTTGKDGALSVELPKTVQAAFPPTAGAARSFLVVAPGHDCAQVGENARDEEIDVTLGAGVAVTGRLTAAGRAVGGAELLCEIEKVRAILPLRTGADGTFTTPAVRPGSRVTLRAALPASRAGESDYSAWPAAILWSGIADPALAPLSLDAEKTNVLDVQVLAPGGAPVAGARVVALVDEGGEWRPRLWAVADRMGRVRLGVPDLPCEVAAVADDGSHGSGQRKRAARFLFVHLVRPVILMGRVLTAAGTPAAGVTVQVQGHETGIVWPPEIALLQAMVTRTDAEGRFRLPVPVGGEMYRVFAGEVPGAIAEEHVHVGADGASVDLKLEPPAAGDKH